MSKERNRGTRWETAIVEFLRSEGIPAYRNALSSPYGDIGGIDGMVIEAKDQREQRLAIWVDQAIEECERLSAKTDQPILPVVVAKRRMRPTKDAYCVIPLWAVANLLNNWYSLSGSKSGTEN